jgi:DNA modification methylase/DNA-directed RNA polymerase subunit RPC12/RpoP
MFGSDKDAASKQPVECLGMTFSNDEARRQHFLEKLREKLKDPAFRKIEGFPIGDDEDILALSDPPYYTACPNPFLDAFCRLNGHEYNKASDSYSRQPFSADVSEGKNDPIYNVHSYHTKVPHKAIMRYILHYTEPGQIVFDGFCGTGMTGVAAQFCEDRIAVESLGYKVKPDGTILDTDGTAFSRIGSRHVILSDLSPVATSIAYSYNAPVDSETFKRQAADVLEQVQADCGWMYLTLHRPKPAQLASALALAKTHQSDFQTAGDSLPWGTINYTVWSDVFICSECSGDLVFWEVAVDREAGEVRDDFACPHCRARLTKRRVERAFVTVRDSALHQTIRQAKQIPVLINYTFGKQRLEKTPDEFDKALIARIDNDKPPVWFPTDRMPEGEESRRNDDIGVTHVHHFYTKRNLWTLASYAAHSRDQELVHALLFILTGAMPDLLKSARLRIGAYFHGGRGAVSAGVSGTHYLPSLSVEKRVLFGLENRFETVAQVLYGGGFSQKRSTAIVSNQSLTTLDNLPSSVDYIFTDPPFGGNLMYSELNCLWESWLRVTTNNASEAIENSSQQKGLREYQNLMTRCFGEYYRVLKPGRWMTVEFHNSQNRVWAAIQEAIQHAGFVVSDVRTLDKQQSSFKQCTSANAVKQDLVISAYKPSQLFEEQFRLSAGTEAGAWEFVRSHLNHVPLFVAKGGRAEVVVERQGYLLFDRMVAFHVQRGYSVPLSASEFSAGLRQRFPERDCMYFLPNQVGEYDRQRVSITEIEQLELFVNDEKTAIQWVRQQLVDRQITYKELSPLYMKEAQRVWEKHEQPMELITILEQNFIKSLDNTWRIPDPKKEADLEQLRHRALIKEFQQYLDAKGKLKVVRTEALRVGFKECWQKQDYATIVRMAKRVPDAVIQEDQALLMYFDNALMRTGE